MDPTAWLQKALDELKELAQFADWDSEDAWRAAVLTARLLGSPTGPTPPTEFVSQLGSHIRAAGIPEPQLVLEAVASELESDTEPWGSLLDSLLDADDTVLVLHLHGVEGASTRLANRVAALVSLYPERVLSLGEFADMRLQTVRQDAPSAVIWKAVEKTAARILADALPEQLVDLPKASLGSSQMVKPAVRSPLHYQVPAERLRAAAAGVGAEHGWKLEAEALAPPAWVNEEGGRHVLEFRLLSGRPLALRLVAERACDGKALCARSLDFTVEGNTVYADLGTALGAESVLWSIVEEAGLPADQIRVCVQVEYD